jgi:hypothetical protein
MTDYALNYSSATGTFGATAGGTALTSQFNAYLSATINTATGDGTALSPIIFDNDTDPDGVYDVSSGLFTAPTAGNYLFNCVLYMGGFLAAHNVMICHLFVNGGYYALSRINPYNVADGSGYMFITMTSGVVALGAGGTAGIYLQISGGTKVIYIGGTGVANSRFCGFKLGTA